MPSLIYSPSSIRDIERLVSFLKKKSVKAAANAAVKIDAALSMLEQHPNMGRPVDGMEIEYRELLIPFGGYGYVARYRYAGGDSVELLAVRHYREAGFE